MADGTDESGSLLAKYFSPQPEPVRLGLKAAPVPQVNWDGVTEHILQQEQQIKSIQEAKVLFDEFHKLVIGQLKPDVQVNHLDKLAVFSGIWQYPSRVKCAILSWHTMNGAIENKKAVSTE